jgi:hypothetical protein
VAKTVAVVADKATNRSAVERAMIAAGAASFAATVGRRGARLVRVKAAARRNRHLRRKDSAARIAATGLFRRVPRANVRAVETFGLALKAAGHRRPIAVRAIVIRLPTAVRAVRVAGVSSAAAAWRRRKCGRI